MARATIDRFEGELAVLLVDGGEVTRPRSSLPSEAKEGDVVDVDTGQVDTEATERLLADVRSARAQAFGKKAKPGSFD